MKNVLLLDHSCMYSGILHKKSSKSGLNLYVIGHGAYADEILSNNHIDLILEDAHDSYLSAILLESSKRQTNFNGLHKRIEIKDGHVIALKALGHKGKNFIDDIIRHIDKYIAGKQKQSSLLH